MRQENAALVGEAAAAGRGQQDSTNLAPGAVVLADAGPDKPLLVAADYGEGRVMAFAGDSTWRWWMHGFESAHKRFWRQVVLWLAQKDQAQEGNVWIRLPSGGLRRRSGSSSSSARSRRRAIRSRTPTSRLSSYCPAAIAVRLRWCGRMNRWSAR